MLDINGEFVSGEVRKRFFGVIDREFNSRYYNILNCFFQPIYNFIKDSTNSA